MTIHKFLNRGHQSGELCPPKPTSRPRMRRERSPSPAYSDGGSSGFSSISRSRSRSRSRGHYSTRVDPRSHSQSSSYSSRSRSRSRSPSPSAVISPDTIGIEGLSRNVTAAHIKEIFARYGDIQEVYFPVDRKTGHGRGGAKVRYTAVEEAGKAIRGMNGGQLDGNVLQVSLCQTPAIRTSSSDKGHRPLLSRGRSPLRSPPSPSGPRTRGRARSRSYSRSRSRSHSYSPNRDNGYHARGVGRRSPRSYHARSPARR